MKPILSMMVFLLCSSSLIITANAGSVTTTTTVTTVKTVKKSTCHKKYKKRHYYSRGCSSYYGCSYYDESYYNRCPGGAWDCYFDLHGRHFQQEYIPVSYGHDVRYSCLQSEDPGSCS